MSKLVRLKGDWSVDIDAGLTVSARPLSWSPGAMSEAVVMARLQNAIDRCGERKRTLLAVRHELLRRRGK